MESPLFRSSDYRARPIAAAIRPWTRIQVEVKRCSNWMMRRCLPELISTR